MLPNLECVRRRNDSLPLQCCPPQMCFSNSLLVPGERNNSSKNGSQFCRRLVFSFWRRLCSSHLRGTAFLHFLKVNNTFFGGLP